MLRLSANVLITSARPSPLVSSRILMVSLACRLDGAAMGYSLELETQSRPRRSKAMFIGLAMSGSLTTN